MRTIGYIPPRPQPIREMPEKPADAAPAEGLADAPQEKPAKKSGKGAKQDG